MYDGWKIIVGLVIGVIMLAYPFWPSTEKWAAKTPEPELTAKAQEAKVCVEPKSYIKTEHMKLLDQWREVTFPCLCNVQLQTIRFGDSFFEQQRAKRRADVPFLRRRESR